MKYAVVLSLFAVSVFSPVLMSGTIRTTDPALNRTVNNPLNPALSATAEVLYDSLDLASYGLNQEAFEYAWRGFITLAEKGVLRNTDYFTICDFSQSSRNKRLYIIDLVSMRVLKNTYVAHGRNSGGEYAQYFSNKPQSNKSSLGFYVTEKTYFGQHGLSLRINGVERGINDKALARRIVIHGSDYVGDRYLQRNPFIGRSFGCPAIPLNERDEIINTIKEGTCLFIYHPSKLYLSRSKILNG